MPESGWKIPDDWEGENWTCYQIKWPDSEDYRRLLVGLLFTLTRGREYDGKTGTVRDAQKTGWQIFDTNVPLLLCDASGDTDETPYSETPYRIEYRGSAFLVVSGDDMGQVVTDVQIVNGKIRVFFGPCCWRDLESYSFPVEGEDTYDPDKFFPDPPPELVGQGLACRRAWYMATQFMQFANAAYTFYNPISPIPIVEYSAALRNAFRQYKLSTWSVFKLYQTAQALVAAEFFIWSDAISSVDTQRLICLFEAGLNGDSYELTRAEYDSMKHAVGKLATGVVDTHIRTAFDALNFSSFEALSFASQYVVTAQDCGCPGAALYTYDWMYTYDFLLNASDAHQDWGGNQTNWFQNEGWLSLVRSNPTDLTFGLTSPYNSGATAGTVRYWKIEGGPVQGAMSEPEDSTNGFQIQIDGVATDFMDYTQICNLLASGGVAEGYVEIPYDQPVSGRIRLRCAARFEETTSGQVRVMRITIGGTGTPPIRPPLVTAIA